MRLTPSDTVDHVDLNGSFRRPSSSHEERILRINPPPASFCENFVEPDPRPRCRVRHPLAPGAELDLYREGVAGKRRDQRLVSGDARTDRRTRCRAIRALKLKDWALAIARRSTLRKARIALARRLAIIMHAMLRHGTEFKPA